MDEEKIVNSDGETTDLEKTKEQTDRKCPDCGGVMDFDPATGGMKCPYCGHEEAIKAEGSTEELDFSKAEFGENVDWGASKKTVICKSCGAESIYDSLQVASVCPYCGSNQVMSESAKDTLAPGGVCPFKVDAKTAGANFTKWIKGRLFCPSKAKKSAKADAFKGVYLPYWTFDSNTVSEYTAKYGIDREVSDKDGNTHTETDWYRTAGTLLEAVDDELVKGTNIHDPSLLGRIEPFDTADNLKYKPEYLAGFAAERYSVGIKDAWETAKQSIKRRIEGLIENKVMTENFADRVADVRFDTVFSDVTYKYLMLPIWMSSFKYKQKVYQFLVNGQTGKVGGKTPVSALRVIIAILIAAAVIVGIWALFTYVFK